MATRSSVTTAVEDIHFVGALRCDKSTVLHGAIWVAPCTPWYVVECCVSTRIDWNSNPARRGGVGPLDTLGDEEDRLLDMY